jgi:hypothetical protein
VGSAARGGPSVVALRKTVKDTVTQLLRASGLPRINETLANLSIQIESGPTVRAGTAATSVGPNVWVLFPTYHGERQSFNGFCEDAHPGCECTGQKSTCTAKLCRGKTLCRTLAHTSAIFVEHARALSAALSAQRQIGGKQLERVQPSVFYDDCWEGRGRCQGRRPCMEPGDHMLSCRATAMLCAERWSTVLDRALAWIPAAHGRASFLYLYDGPSQDLFDETFRTWSSSSVGYGSDVILFGPQFASVKPRLLNTSLSLIASACRRADACRSSGSVTGTGPGASTGGRRRETTLIFRTPAFNIDPVNTFKQQRTFEHRVRPLVERLGVTFLDMYTATRHAVLQRTSNAVRFDHFSAFHFHDAGRYIQAELFLHTLRLLQ